MLLEHINVHITAALCQCTCTPLYSDNLMTVFQVIIMFVVLVILSVISAICYAIWNAVWAEKSWYLGMDHGKVDQWMECLTCAVCLHNSTIQSMCLVCVFDTCICFQRLEERTS